MNKPKTTQLFLALALLLAACSGVQAEQATSSDPTWIDAPLDQSTIPQAPTTIVFSTSTDAEFDHFELWVNGSELASVPQAYSSQNEPFSYIYGQYDWEPTAPGTYLIQVRGVTSDGTGPFAEAQVMVQGQIEPIQGVEETPPSIEVLAIPLQDTNCRYGCQASQFEVADTLFEGIGYEINAISDDGLFVQFIGPATGQLCWAPASLLDLQLNGESVEASTLITDYVSANSCPATPTPLPTDTPVPTSTPLPPQCSDGIDNDGDGRIDYSPPSTTGTSVGDRECDSPSDNDESN